MDVSLLKPEELAAIQHIAREGGAERAVTMDYPQRLMNFLARVGLITIHDRSATKGQWRWQRVSLTDAGKVAAFDSGTVYVYPQQAPMRLVTIPACEMHEGFHAIAVRLIWLCPNCGHRREEPVDGFSYDGSLRLAVDTWGACRRCGRIDKYSECREEARRNGLNKEA